MAARSKGGRSRSEGRPRRGRERARPRAPPPRPAAGGPRPGRSRAPPRRGPCRTRLYPRHETPAPRHPGVEALGYDAALGGGRGPDGGVGGRRVVMIDQRRLPLEVELLRCRHPPRGGGRHPGHGDPRRPGDRRRRRAGPRPRGAREPQRGSGPARGLAGHVLRARRDAADRGEPVLGDRADAAPLPRPAGRGGRTRCAGGSSARRSPSRGRTSRRAASWATSGPRSCPRRRAS
jgi:hypothetical protein